MLEGIVRGGDTGGCTGVQTHSSKSGVRSDRGDC